MDLGLVLDPQPNCCLLLLVIELLLLLDQVRVHLCFLELLLVLSFLVRKLDLELLSVHNSLLLLNGKLLIVQRLFSGLLQLKLFRVVFSFLLRDF